MSVRSYPRLPIETFGRQIIVMDDLDPVYTALSRMDWDADQLYRWLVAYWCLYHVGLSSWLSERQGLDFWHALNVAAVNAVAAPTGGRWPRAPERRHWRGENALKCVRDLRERYQRPEQMVEFIARSTRPDGQLTFGEVSARVTTHTAFGPWIAFKVADMLERCGIVPVQFTLDDAMFDSPRQAALRVWRERAKVSPDVRIKDEAAAVRQVVAHLLTQFEDLDAPPAGGRRIGYQEVETVLCKWQSHMNGHYAPGHDLRELRASALEWAPHSDTSKEFAYRLGTSEQPGPLAS